ncbi:MAG TPA: hypothetical protein VHZ78_00285 [Rhizomicrobium sp.]|jgi:hypothetical protein|nr:hypothetical protein [Rhizomicrobium sp.]
MIAAAAALLLLAATIAVWFVAGGARPAARVQIRFTGVLFAALAPAMIVLPPAGAAVTLLVLPVGLSILSLASIAGFSRPLPAGAAALFLALVCLAGLTAAITGLAVLSLAPCAVAILALIAIFLRQFDAARLASVQGMASALCFLGAVSSFAATGADAALLLFAAAGLLGTTLALSRSDVAVEEAPVRDLRSLAAVSGHRPD